MNVRKKHSSPEELEVPTGLRRFLYASAATTGAAIMIIEILGAKMLAPFFGTSHFVWTAQIAVTLVALSAGYYVGGKLVDQLPKLSRLYGCILLAAIYLAFTISFVEPVSYWCLQFKLAAGCLLASAFLFFVPLALLAMVGPFIVRVLTISVNHVGGNIGRLTAISTLGSVLGTVLIGYVLVPLLPNSVTLYLTSGVLMIPVAAYFLVWERRGATTGAVGAGMALGLLVGYGGTTKEGLLDSDTTRELYRANSNFGLLQVLENKEGNRRFYLNDYLIQNIYDPIQKKSMAVFTYALHHLAHAYTPKLEKALCIGLGVGIVPMQFAQEGIRVDVVEINPDVLPLATNLFDCDLNRFNLHLGDGRYFINQTPERYDTIILDAFLGDSSPSHLMTQEAFQAMRRILNPEGTLVMNTFGELQEGRDFFPASLEKTLKAVFRSVRMHAAGNGNIFFVATDQPDPKVLREPDFSEVHSYCLQASKDAFTGVQSTDPAHGEVLTDDYNPIEFYDAANREEYRHRLARRMQSL